MQLISNVFTSISPSFSHLNLMAKLTLFLWIKLRCLIWEIKALSFKDTIDTDAQNTKKVIFVFAQTESNISW